MQTRTIRDLTVLLPGEDPDEVEAVHHIPADRSITTGRRITGDVWARTTFGECTIAGSWFINADLTSIEHTGMTYDRCVLRGCNLTGAHLATSTLKNVIFENCRVDFATLAKARVTGPVAFLGCSLIETVFDRCTLRTTVFDGCKFSETEFESCDMRGADLRGNDLSNLVGVTTSLRGATISDEQIPALTNAVTRELELTVKDWRP